MQAQFIVHTPLCRLLQKSLGQHFRATAGVSQCFGGGQTQQSNRSSKGGDPLPFNSAPGGLLRVSGNLGCIGQSLPTISWQDNPPSYSTFILGFLALPL